MAWAVNSSINWVIIRAKAHESIIKILLTRNDRVINVRVHLKVLHLLSVLIWMVGRKEMTTWPQSEFWAPTFDLQIFCEPACGSNFDKFTHLKVLTTGFGNSDEGLNLLGAHILIVQVYPETCWTLALVNWDAVGILVSNFSHTWNFCQLGHYQL